MTETESILTSIKKMLGITEEYEYFDPDIIMHINSAFTVLRQLRVGPKEGFMITDKSASWQDFVPAGQRLQAIKTYVYLKVRVVFDPPSASTVLDAFKDDIKELEWRLNVECDPDDSDPEVDG